MGVCGMRNALFATTGALAIGLFVAPVFAADVEAPATDETTLYVSLFAGASFLDDLNTLQDYADPGDTDFDYTLETKTGYILGGAVGMRLWEPVRAEVEVSYSRWKADQFSFERETDDPNPPPNEEGEANGHLSALYLLGNLWFDFNSGTSFTPYLGGGAGVAWVDADTTFFPSFSGDTGYRDGEMGFAFQAGAGVQFALTERLALDIGYRFKGILDVDFDNPRDEDGPVYGDGDLYSHNVQGGMSFSF